MNTPGYTEVFLSLILVVLSIVISRVWKINAEKELAIGSVRSFIQLVAVGYALNFIFDLESVWLILLAIVIMITVGAFTAAGRVKAIPGMIKVTFTAVFVGSVLTIGSMLLLNIIAFEAKYIIPLGGMIISNSMNSSALTAERIYSNVAGNKLAIESSLALGKTWRESSAVYIRQATMAGMMSMLNFFKTVGLVALPGAMTGMILAGADPLDAVLLQVIVGYMLLFATVIASVVSVEMTIRKLFSSCQQLTLPRR